MSTPAMKTNIKNRVKNLSIGATHILQTLYEAISNSLHAIQAKKDANGKIEIQILRDTSQTSISGAKGKSGQVSGIIVQDNGEGFTAKNYESFLTLDSESKLNVGGKGVGRLVWLKFFERVHVESVYQEGEQRRRRTFEFALPTGIVNEHDDAVSESCETGTKIEMKGLEPKMANAWKHKASTVKANILKHFLYVFLAAKPPRILIRDEDECLELTGDDLPKHKREQQELGGEAFELVHAEVPSPVDSGHFIFYCANGRVVESEKIKALPVSKLAAEGGQFFYQIYVSSPYLDARNSQERTTFALEEERNTIDAVSKSELRELIVARALNYLHPVLEKHRAERNERISTIIERDMPELKYLEEQSREELNNIPLDESETRIGEKVAEIHFKNLREGRKLLQQVVEDLKNKATFDANIIMQKFDKDYERIVKINQASFLSYLLYRKAVIDLYEELLRKSSDGFQKEAAIHELFFPMGKDLEPSKAFSENNLWLIDERLTYASYIASDLALKDHKHLFAVTDKGEPDVVAYYNLSYTADSLDDLLNEVVIVEFKRPGPLPSRPEDPLEQVYRYIDEILKGTYSYDGKKIKAAGTTRFYCYIVCDLESEKIRKLVRYGRFKAVFGGREGYFLYNEEMNAHIELVPFEKILRGARRNHRAFFERSGLAPGK